MVLFVMLSIFTWLKSKVNTHGFKVQLEERHHQTVRCMFRVLSLGINLTYYFLFCKLGQDWFFFFFNSGVRFGNLAILESLTWCCTQLQNWLSLWFGETLTQWMNFVYSSQERSCTSSHWVGVLKSVKTSRGSASKWS